MRSLLSLDWKARKGLKPRKGEEEVKEFSRALVIRVLKPMLKRLFP
jgi:hypothetical protein